jgi:hypothetical protein
METNNFDLKYNCDKLDIEMLMLEKEKGDLKWTIPGEKMRSLIEEWAD